MAAIFKHYFMEKFAKSADPIQNALRDHKKKWNLAAKEFIKRTIAFKRTLNGQGDSAYSLPASNIKDPLPKEIGSFMSQLASLFESLVKEADVIMREQDNYSKTRKKSKKELEQTASTKFNFIKTAFPKRTGTLRVANQELTTLLALSESEQAAGLMHTPAPAPVMSFVYKKPQITKFWMHNTQAPLDIVFSLNGKITSIYQGEPFSTKLIGDQYPSDLVVEFPQGTCQKLGIKIGDPINLIYG